MRRRSPIRNYLEYWAARFALATIARGPLGLARFYARLLDMAMPRLRRAALRNLELTGYPASYADRAFDSLARLLHTLARFPRIDRSNVDEWIRYDGRKHFDEALKKGRGVLFATAHLGNWELSAFAHALMAEPMSFVVRPFDNPLLDDLVTRYRTLSGNRVCGKTDFVRSILRALGRNEAVGILVDHNTGLDEGVFVDFFGHKACVDPTFAKLAWKTGAPVIPGFAVWSEEERRYILKFYPPLELTGDVISDTQRVQSAVEQAIREHPDQWLWVHRRWKTRPPGELPLY